MDFPIFKTRMEGVDQSFNLSDPKERKKYFALKAGEEIEKLNAYLKEGNTFVGYLLGKKNSGKGTYSKLFAEALETDKVEHVSVGDIIRDIHAALESGEEKKKAFLQFLKEQYRGFHSPEETLDLILGRSQKKLIPTELIVALLKYEISERPRHALFIDGFPRAHDQIHYSLYLKELVGYRDDPDFLVFINVPNKVIDERIRYRVVCPICKTPRNTKLLATNKAGYDEDEKKHYLMCDNPDCEGARMVPKEGDELGIRPIRKRLKLDDQVMEKLMELHGVPKIYLRNSIPVDEADTYADDYEITPEYGYETDNDSGEVKIIEKPWVIKDDRRVKSYSLLPAAVVVSLIKQVADALDL